MSNSNLAIQIDDQLCLDAERIRAIDRAVEFVGGRVECIRVLLTDRIDGRPYISVIENVGVVYLAREPEALSA